MLCSTATFSSGSSIKSRSTAGTQKLTNLFRKTNSALLSGKLMKKGLIVALCLSLSPTLNQQSWASSDSSVLEAEAEAGARAPSGDSDNHGRVTHRLKGGSIVLEGLATTRVEQLDADISGTFSVEIASGISLKDRASGRSIPIEASYPKTGGNFPIVILSHGAIASARDYRFLATAISSHGYICILPTHKDALKMNRDKNQSSKVSLWKLIRLAKLSDKELLERTDDLEKVIDSLPMLTEKLNHLDSRWNRKIAIFGHEAGAHASWWTSSRDARKNTEVNPYKIDANLSIVGLNWGLPRISDEMFEGVDTPTMVISLSHTPKDLSGVRKSIREAMQSKHASDRYLVSFDFDHDSFPGRAKALRMLRKSNIKLIDFKPIRLLGKRRKGLEQDSNSNTDQINESPEFSEADLSELPGSEIQNILGLERPEEDAQTRKNRLDALIATIIPFLDAYLTQNKDALELLRSLDRSVFEGDIVTTTEHM